MNSSSDTILSFDDFVLLLIVTLSDFSNTVFLKKVTSKMVRIPVGNKYKHTIKKMISLGDEYIEKLTLLIDLGDFFDDSDEWEFMFFKSLEKLLHDLNKEFKYDFENDKIYVIFSIEELKYISSKFMQNDINDAMHDFVNLLTSYDYDLDILNQICNNVNTDNNLDTNLI